MLFENDNLTKKDIIIGTRKTVQYDLTIW